jgi:beta-1,4-mannosyl-glycoprotein beta-1,4-N-acetylglucosaminyltransferase
MKLYDCCMYFDEDLILDLRLNTLNNHVDKFVIAEATRDHKGNEKKLNFDIKNFSQFKEKIIYIIVDDIPLNVKFYKKNWPSHHLRDQYQRNALSRGYKNCNEEDLIMISDIDEIPDPNKIKEFNIKNKYACFMQKNFQSKINLINVTDKYWMGTKIIKKKYLKSPQWLRNIKTSKPAFWKIYKPKQPQLIYDGGWHFSFLKNPRDISKKIKSYSHSEYNKSIFTDEKKIEERIKSKVDIFDRNFKYEKVDLDDTFPEYIIKNLGKYKDWIV